jgi:cytochrome c-type biogenesis protein CcmF
VSIELAHFAFILAMFLSVLQSVLPFAFARLPDETQAALARRTAYAQFFLLLLSFIALVERFMVVDFSVLYVAQTAHSELPWYYRFSAVWGGHEGSLLFWTLILALWIAAFAYASKTRMAPRFATQALSVLGFSAVGFLSFTALTSNPFLRQLPVPAEGSDLNPLLQDIGLIIHPPLLYIGYVGLAVPFALAVAALWRGEKNDDWIRFSRPWTLTAFAFLTLGIALGSWWAYYELGWGGYWFWDPVENASFMPWLLSVALLHSQAVAAKRGAFIEWCVLLSIAAFSLSLLGTFLVRSGVLTSVHAFASDPERGMYILAIFAICVGAALILYTFRIERLTGTSSANLASREGMLLANNLAFAAATAMVLLGTLYPLLAELLNLGKISVGPPYFGTMFIVLMAPVIVLMPLGPLMRWQQDSLQRVLGVLNLPLIFAVVATVLIWIFDRTHDLVAMITLFGAFWLALGTLRYLQTVAQQAGGFSRLRLPTLGLVTAHLGVAVLLIGVGMVESKVLNRDVVFKPGETHSIGNYSFKMISVEKRNGPNYVADYGTFEVFRDGELITTMHPEKRSYSSQRANVMTEADIQPGLTRDLYIALGDPRDNGAWTVRTYIKPYVRWIWFGALMIAIGGFIGALARRVPALRVATIGSANAAPLPALNSAAAPAA